MKKFVLTIAVVLSAIFGASITASAVDISEITAVSTVVRTSAVVAEKAVENSYVESVIAEMFGRAGASTATGAKGIVFEVMLRDKMNLENLFNSGVTTQLSASSTNSLADLVTTDASGNVIELIQCKDGTSYSQIYSVFKDVQAGKYEGTTLYGTTEFAETYNEYAAAHGMEQIAVDSGISTKTTSQIAQRALGIESETSLLLKSCGQAAGMGAIVGGVVALIESLQTGCDVYDTIAHVTIDSTTSAITMGLMPVVVHETSVILITAGATGAVASITPVVIGFLVPTAIGYCLTVATEAIGLEEVLSNLAEQAGDIITTTIEVVVDYVDEADISGYFSLAWESVSNTAATVGTTVSNAATAVGTTVSSTASTVGTYVGSAASTFGASVAEKASDLGSLTLEAVSGLLNSKA